MTILIGTPHTHNAGYYYDGAGKERREADVQTCKHCEAVILMQEWKKEGGWCAKCQSPLCNNPACVAETARLGCVPFTKKLEMEMERVHRLKNIFKLF